ncbi:glycosyl hydrolase [Saccharibacillus kuerlensis]|nr:glycosyl hydrolase [Saccharibacillus kuerlensis]
MMNPNHTIATYLKPSVSQNPDIVAGKEALLESVGLWMAYNLKQNNQTEFDKNLNTLQSFFTAPEHYWYWKLEPDGTSQVTTNALGDDLRLLNVLLHAYDVWGNEAYLKEARLISQTLQQETAVNGYLVDYHNFADGTSAATLNLAYIDIEAFERMNFYELMDDATLQRYTSLLKSLPQDSVFYPQRYNVKTGQYESVEEVNMTEQLIAAIHVHEAGQMPTKLLDFLRQQYEQQGKIVGRYDRSSLKGTVPYESPSVYALAAMLFMDSNDSKWAGKMIERMLQFRDQDSRYPGGYVFGGDTHAFDNLFPLLAEQQWKTDKRNR